MNDNERAAAKQALKEAKDAGDIDLQEYLSELAKLRLMLQPVMNMNNWI